MLVLPCPLLLGVVQLVHVAVYLLQADVILEVAAQVVHRGFLAHGLADKANDQMT